MNSGQGALSSEPCVGIRAAPPDVYVWQEGSQVLRLEHASRDPAHSSLIIAQKNFLSELLGH